MRLAALLLSLVVVAIISKDTRAQYWGGYYDNKAATAGESYMRGFSDVIRSQGEANLRNSEAAINYEEARSREYDNRLKGTQTYFEMRRMNTQYREQERGPRITQQQADHLAASRAPSRINANQVDPLTGEIAWPMVLTDEPYTKYREKLQDLFAQRAQRGGSIGLSSYNEIQTVCKQLEQALVANINKYQPSQYVDGKRFIEQLAYEARFPTG